MNQVRSTTQGSYYYRSKDSAHVMQNLCRESQGPIHSLIHLSSENMKHGPFTLGWSIVLASVDKQLLLFWIISRSTGNQ